MLPYENIQRKNPNLIQYIYNIKVDLPPPVHFSICTEGFPYLNISKKKHTICMGEVPKS